MTFTDSLVDPLRAVSVLDPAIDRVASRVVEYSETRDPALIVELPGARAFWCVVHPLSVAEFASVDSLPTGPTKLVQAFRLAVAAIENAGGPGIAMRPSRSHPREDGVDRPMWSDRDLAHVFHMLGAQFIYEIGQLAYERAIQGNGWSGSVSYTLPQSSLTGLAAIARQLAARERESASTARNASSASGPTPTPPRSSDAPTAADAPSGAAAPAAGR